MSVTDKTFSASAKGLLVASNSIKIRHLKLFYLWGQPSDKF